MRSITTNWNSSTYNNATTFVDKISGSSVTIPANTPVNVRSMIDSVESGGYIYQPDGVVVNQETLSTAVDDEDVVVVTITNSAVPVAGAPITVTFAETTIVSVSPMFAYAAANGTASFTITSLASGSAEVFFNCGDIAAETIVTVA